MEVSWKRNGSWREERIRQDRCIEPHAIRRNRNFRGNFASSPALLAARRTCPQTRVMHSLQRHFCGRLRETLACLVHVNWNFYPIIITMTLPCREDRTWTFYLLITKLIEGSSCIVHIYFENEINWFLDWIPLERALFEKKKELYLSSIIHLFVFTLHFAFFDVRISFGICVWKREERLTVKVFREREKDIGCISLFSLRLSAQIPE